VWTIPDQADRDEVDALVECAAQKLQIDKPETSGSAGVMFRANVDRVGEALDKCDERWRTKGLLLSPDRRGG
jgi:hypothetical protein